MSTPHVVIVGGGITGLATAYYLQKQAQSQNLPINYTLIESAPTFGGKIETATTNGLIVEGGPDSFITQKREALNLCYELGLEDRLIGTNDHQRKIYTLHNGRLRTLPDGVMLIVPTRFMPFALTPLISPFGKLRMGLDYFIPPKKDETDESLADFIGRRLGKEALDKIGEPLMAGIYGSDPQKLSINSTFPRFAVMERKHGSLIKGMLTQIKAMRSRANSNNKPKQPLFMTLKGGLVELVQAITNNLSGQLLSGQSVTKITVTSATPKAYQLHLTNGQTCQADAVIMATPSYVAANLLENYCEPLAQKLNAIRYLSTDTVSLAFKRDGFAHSVDGFGFVVPKKESCQISACTWISTKFNHRAPDDQILLRAFVGGYKLQHLVDLDDEALISLVREELKRIMGVTSEPIYQRVFRWPKANPQYDVGHLEHVAQIEALAQEHLPGLYLTGSAFKGIGLPDCIKQGQDTANQAIDYLKTSVLQSSKVAV